MNFDNHGDEGYLYACQTFKQSDNLKNKLSREPKKKILQEKQLKRSCGKDTQCEINAGIVVLKCQR